ncbi:hypothetical protein GUJ93_ZPchr0010g10976 [Zizania palustris]|uniref:DUF4220 domain-containing protein n=1 Tax=Zizania palustris TaxID=103762 RepID=A0A8J5WCX6_ZIZPA|nr:hypothetical protein GUJ93_ZPchr0010g10976 [Zizania palustris]
MGLLGWWEEWQLRVLALGSLGVQFFLAVFGGRRKSRIPPWYRFFIWLSYLGSDALAIYALATLFNRHKKQVVQHSSGNNGGSLDLEVVWAPVLLMHLGGQMFITAYNIEDNELWKRHILTTLSQVTVAVYVFCKSWSSSGDGRLLAAAILLFIPGVLKCVEKPLALKAASFNSLVSSFDRAERAPAKSREEELQRFVDMARAFFHSAGENNTQTFDHDRVIGRRLSVPHKLFVDFQCPFSERLENLTYFWSIDDREAYGVIKAGLSNIFDFLYTKNKLSIRANALAICCCYWTWSLTVPMAVVAIGLFHSSHKASYSHTDVVVTFVMLYGTLVLDITAAFIIKAYDFKWPDIVEQQSLLGFFARKKRSVIMATLGSCLPCFEGLVNKHCFNMDPSFFSKEITKLVRKHVRDGWDKYITDAESYRKLNDTMGQWTLQRHRCDELLGWSLEKPFDESVLLWHLATDFASLVQSSRPGTGTDAAAPASSSSRDMARAISNYMMHLLFANPEMLMPGSRGNLFTTACDELEHLLTGVKPPLPVDDEQSLARAVMAKAAESISKAKQPPKRAKKRSKPEPEPDKGCFFQDAWLLSQQLKGLAGGDGGGRMWDVVRDVWVEMLCFSAGRCRGYLHAKSLGSGAEYLSLVCLLLAHAGMETFPERLHRRHTLRLLKQGHHDDDDDPPSAANLQAQREAAINVPELNEIVVSQ